MPYRVSMSTLNASTIDILNVIRQNASYEYQSLVPEVTKADDIPSVGEALLGYPAMANQFVNALVNRIALVVIRSSTFNNEFGELKKGYLQYGESVEEIFVQMAKAYEYNPEKAPKRELKRTLPDVRSAFHIINWKVQYPVTINEPQLRQAFLSIYGVQDLIAHIVESVRKGANYDEYLLFKYMIIKAITKGKITPVSIGIGTDMEQAGIMFRAQSSSLLFPTTTFNEAHVNNDTPVQNQYIFMDTLYNATYGVKVLAEAFNMDQATYIGKLKLVDSWTTFDNERFNVIMQNSDMLEPVTAAELALMENVKAVLIDKEWFQVYDNLDMFSETYVASGLYWNYFYNVWKTISSSPFANAIAFVTDDANIALPASINLEITDKSASEDAITLTFRDHLAVPSVASSSLVFQQTEDLTKAGIAMHPYGALLIPASQFSTDITIQAILNGQLYTASSTITSASSVGDTITLSKPNS